MKWEGPERKGTISLTRQAYLDSVCLGLNLRVTGHCNQGGRKYMEDVFSVAYQQTEDELDLEYAFFGIYDGHGGKEAALFAKVGIILLCPIPPPPPFESLSKILFVPYPYLGPIYLLWLN